MLFKEEVNTILELTDKLQDLNIEDKIKVCVLCFIFDNNGKLILQRRGPGARNEVGKLQAIGGSVNSSDLTFRDALKREIEEEAGAKAVVKINNFLGAIKDLSYDKNSQQMIDWVLLSYVGTLEDGELINNEPDRCIGFEKKNINDFLENDVSSTTWQFMNVLKENGDAHELSKM